MSPDFYFHARFRCVRSELASGGVLHAIFSKKRLGVTPSSFEVRIVIYDPYWV